MDDELAFLRAENEYLREANEKLAGVLSKIARHFCETYVDVQETLNRFTTDQVKVTRVTMKGEQH